MKVVGLKLRLSDVTGAAVIIGALTGTASAQVPKPVTFAPDANGQINFVLPQHKVMCTYTPKEGTPVYKVVDGPELQCDRVEPKYVRVVLNAKTARRFDKVGDQDNLGVDNVFAPGSRWTQGPFTCDSTASGLTCKRSDGRGFTMGRDIKVQ